LDGCWGGIHARENLSATARGLNFPAPGGKNSWRISKRTQRFGAENAVLNDYHRMNHDVKLERKLESEKKGIEGGFLADF
jgi:hypothetical protein